MKLRSILFCVLTSGLLATSAYAGNALTLSKTAADPDIHTLKVTNTGNRTVYGNATVTVGAMINNVCYAGPSEQPVTFHFSPNSDNWLYLDGDALKNNFGLKYSCGIITLQTDKQTTVDTFALYQDGSTYYGTNPDFDYVTVN